MQVPEHIHATEALQAAAYCSWQAGMLNIGVRRAVSLPGGCGGHMARSWAGGLVNKHVDAAPPLVANLSDSLHVSSTTTCTCGPAEGGWRALPSRLHCTRFHSWRGQS